MSVGVRESDFFVCCCDPFLFTGVPSPVSMCSCLPCHIVCFCAHKSLLFSERNGRVVGIMERECRGMGEEWKEGNSV